MMRVVSECKRLAQEADKKAATALSTAREAKNASLQRVVATSSLTQSTARVAPIRREMIGYASADLFCLYIHGNGFVIFDELDWVKGK